MSFNLRSLCPAAHGPRFGWMLGRAAAACLLVCWLVLPACAEPLKARPADEILAAAREHLNRGRYAEALAAYDALTGLTGDAAINAARGTARCQLETGQLDEARKTLETAIKAHPRSARLRADLALLQLQRGLFEEAQKTIEAALQRDADDPLARLAEARLLTETGQLKEAGNAWRWFVRYYNRVQPTGAEELLAVGEGALQYARWNSVSQIFGFVLNTLCTNALKDNPDAWQALSLSGELLLEKHNRAEALPEFRKALAINPRAAAVQVWLARAALDQQETAEAERLAGLALKINPAFVPALHVQADLAFARGALPEADRILQQAAEVNPHSQQTLARMAAIHVLLGHPPAGQVEGLLEQLEDISQYDGNRKGRFAEITIQVAERNPRPGVYLTEIGTALESRRQYFAAEQFYRAAMRVMPQLAEPKTALGMLYMRIGRTDEARTILDDAFKADPYHVRVSNMRKVLKVLGDYDRIATEHFIVHVDQERDRILGEYMAEYLEEIYPELVREFGFEPPARTHFEIYSTARGLSGHQWFSARMIGLPWIQTIGASTGVIVALTSPAESQKPFNWARVLRHEFVHVITLQQTQFHIPHWFTEALAVRSEGYPRPDEWNRLLLERVPEGDLRTLENLSQGFTSPKSPEDWQFAYCQSRLYAEYMTELAGAESLSRMLAAYRQNQPTEKAVHDVFGISIEQFEAGYLKYLEDLTAELKSGRGTNLDSLSLEDTRAAYEKDPEDANAAGRYAYALLANRDRLRAREVAVEALKLDAQQPEASLVLAQLELRGGDSAAAIKRLEAAHDAANPHREVLFALGKLALESGRNSQAADLFEAGRKAFPWDVEIARNLAAALVPLEETERLEQVLQDLSRLDADSASVRKKLAELAAKAGRPADVIRHARGALEIDVLDVATHLLLGRAFLQTEEYPRAVREFEVATRLKSDDPQLHVELAQALIEAKQPGKAREVLQKVLQQHPDQPGAKSLLDGLPK